MTVSHATKGEAGSLSLRHFFWLLGQAVGLPQDRSGTLGEPDRLVGGHVDEAGTF